MKKKVVNKSFRWSLVIEILGCKVKNGEIYINLSVSGKNKWIRYSQCPNHIDDLR